MQNKDLKATYDEMHQQGPTAWFSDGKEERETILKMGEPWKGKILEIGCGEGFLADMLLIMPNINYVGIDFSKTAIEKVLSRHPTAQILNLDYRQITFQSWDILVMQGVLEHLDDPFGELQWMIEHFKPKTVITSSPCFLNPRGIVWMTLDMLGAVMSKTDLHFLHPYQFREFAKKHGYKIETLDCDLSWGFGLDMINDLRQRIPLALKDGGIFFDQEKIDDLLNFLEICPTEGRGATMVYRIDIP